MTRRRVAVVGAGLAGAACAQVFARHNYDVVVYEQADRCAAQASGVPLALFAPSISSDDAPHSRCLRRGVHKLLEELVRLTQLGLLREGQDWARTGVLERCLRTPKKLPHTWLSPQDPPEFQSAVVSGGHLSQAPKDALEIFHGMAGWLDPKRLVWAWLNHPKISIQYGQWVRDLAEVDEAAVVIAGGYQTHTLVPQMSAVLQPIRGQVEWGVGLTHSVSAHPVNGMGHWIEVGAGSHARWLVGATFQRHATSLTPHEQDVKKNFDKLAQLLPSNDPATLNQLQRQSQSWVGVRAAQKNRQPWMGRITMQEHSHVWVCAGLGARGVSLAPLCAEHMCQSVTAQWNT